MYKKIFIISLLSIFVYANEVNVYTSRHYEADKQIYKIFTEKTGIKVNIVKAKANKLLKRLKIEDKNTRADLFITSDVGNLVKAQYAGLLQSVNLDSSSKIPSHLKDYNNHWFGLTKRARVIVYAKDRVKKSSIKNYEDLMNKKWNKKITVRSSNNIYNQSLMASIIANKGTIYAKKWAKKVVKNMARSPKGNDRAQIKAIASGTGDLAIVNSYYVGKMITSKDKREREAVKKVGIIFPNQKNRGTHINISGAGVTKYAKNKEEAMKLLDFLLSNKIQKIFAEANFEYPAIKGIALSPVVSKWGKFKEDTLTLPTIGKLNKEAIDIFDYAKWR